MYFQQTCPWNWTCPPCLLYCIRSFLPPTPFSGPNQKKKTPHTHTLLETGLIIQGSRHPKFWAHQYTICSRTLGSKLLDTRWELFCLIRCQGISALAINKWIINLKLMKRHDEYKPCHQSTLRNWADCLRFGQPHLTESSHQMHQILLPKIIKGKLIIVKWA